MTRNSDNANALVDGIVSVGPVGTTMPTDTTADLNAALVDIGWLTDAGIGESGSTDSTPKRGINGAIVKTVKASDDRSFTFETYERNKTVMGITRPGSTPATAGGVTTTHVKSYLGSDERAWVIEQNMGTWIRRVLIPRGQAFQTSPQTDKPGDLAIAQFRLDCYPSSDGTTYIDLTDNPAEAVA